MGERVVLVDANDVPVGTADKLRAHTEGLLHRALSVFLFDSRDALLLQRRARDKYHSGGLWSNACCSHPRPGEPVMDAAARRVREELGLHCAPAPVFSFRYRAAVGAGLWEHEYDHVLIARHEGPPVPDPAEVEAWRWVSVPDVLAELVRRPERFTPWFAPALRGVLASGRVGRIQPPSDARASISAIRSAASGQPSSMTPPGSTMAKK